MAEALESDIDQLLSSDYTNRCPDLIKRTEIDLSPFDAPTCTKVAYLLSHVFSESECEALINHTEGLGYSPALIHLGDKAVHMHGYRDSQRIMIDSKNFSSILFQRIGHLLPQTWPVNGTSGGHKLMEINERFRFLRYDPGDEFKPHQDSSYGRLDGSAVTRVTLQMYLNQGFEGGETTFLNPNIRDKTELLERKNRVPVVPKTGTVLVFQHDILHEGSLLKEGKKYTIRTDVLYKLNQDKDKCCSH